MYIYVKEFHFLVEVKCGCAFLMAEFFIEYILDTKNKNTFGSSFGFYPMITIFKRISTVFYVSHIYLNELYTR